jgi:hypothetical protein
VRPEPNASFFSRNELHCRDEWEEPYVIITEVHGRISYRQRLAEERRVQEELNILFPTALEANIKKYCCQTESLRVDVLHSSHYGIPTHAMLEKGETNQAGEHMFIIVVWGDHILSWLSTSYMILKRFILVFVMKANNNSAARSIFHWQNLKRSGEHIGKIVLIQVI